jgi:sugar transferase (PEP-CTERM system associated)
MILRVFRHFVPVSIICLAVSDLALVCLALQLSLEGSFLPAHYSNGFWSPSIKLSALIAVAAVASGLYDGKTFSTYRSLLTQIAFSFIACCAFLIVGNLFFSNWLGTTDPSWPGTRDWGWEVEKAAFTWLVCILFTRAVFITLADLNVFKRRVLVLGNGERAARILALSEAGDNPHFVAIKYLDWTRPRTGDADQNRSGGVRESIVPHIRELEIDEIVVAMDDRRGLPVGELLECRKSGIKVTDYLDFLERETNRIDIDALKPGWLVFSDGFRITKRAKFFKRILDVSCSAILLLLTLPLLLLTSIAILADSPGPVLYRQKRVGIDGRHFVLLKFRSMCVDAEHQGQAQWACDRDPRTTRTGKIIRRVRIDELPQLFNVLKGDMSFVGPRPERPVFVDEFVEQIPFYGVRHYVKPGITGWAQVKYRYGASKEDACTKLSYDLYYVKNHGVFLDLLIVIQTIRVILWADGAR